MTCQTFLVVTTGSQVRWLPVRGDLGAAEHPQCPGWNPAQSDLPSPPTVLRVRDPPRAALDVAPPVDPETLNPHTMQADTQGARTTLPQPPLCCRDTGVHMQEGPGGTSPQL